MNALQIRFDECHEGVVQRDVTVDWMHRDSARANIRRHVKWLLRRYYYLPDPVLCQNSALLR